MNSNQGKVTNRKQWNLKKRVLRPEQISAGQYNEYICSKPRSHKDQKHTTTENCELEALDSVRPRFRTAKTLSVEAKRVYIKNLTDLPLSTVCPSYSYTTLRVTWP